MPPLFLLFGIGRQSRFPIPLPIFLLWPLVALAWLLLFLIALALPPGTAARHHVRFGRAAVAIFMHLSGLKIDLTTADGTNLYFLFI